MKPTLYADDLWPASGRGSGLRAIKAARNSLVRILPRRCDICGGDGQCCSELDKAETGCTNVCPACDGRGWLYPDPPEWYAKHVCGWGETTIGSWIEQFGGGMDDFVAAMWAGQCDFMWRATGIIE